MDLTDGLSFHIINEPITPIRLFSIKIMREWPVEFPTLETKNDSPTHSKKHQNSVLSELFG